jgi:hypothetical protein
MRIASSSRSREVCVSWTRGGCVLGVCFLVTACSNQAPTRSDAPFPVALTVNDLPTGTFYCRDGLRIVTTLGNPTAQPIQIRGLTLKFSSPECGDHDVPLTAGGQVAPGASMLVRRVDLSGDLCQAPNGRPGCTWDTIAEVDTDEGVASGRLWFATFRSDGRNCGPQAPRVLAPLPGATLAGVTTISVLPAPADATGDCATSPRTLIRLYPLYGGPPLLSEFLAGDSYAWDTRGVRNAEYLITAQKACGVCDRCACGGIGTPVRVAVQN